MNCKAISLFTGAGGLDIGFERAEFHIAAAVEMDPDSLATLEKRGSRQVIGGDVHYVSSERILGKAEALRGEIEFANRQFQCLSFSSFAGTLLCLDKDEEQSCLLLKKY